MESPLERKKEREKEGRKEEEKKNKSEREGGDRKYPSKAGSTALEEFFLYPTNQ